MVAVVLGGSSGRIGDLYSLSTRSPEGDGVKVPKILPWGSCPRSERMVAFLEDGEVTVYRWRTLSWIPLDGATVFMSETSTVRP